MVRAFARKNCNKLGLPIRKGWFQRRKVSSWQGCQSRLCEKEKEQSHPSKLLDCEMEENQGERELHLGKKEKGQRGSMERKESSPR